jgi:acyl-CoA thioesterase FadM
MWIKEIGSKSFKFHYQLADAADPAVTFATGESVQACFRIKKDNPRHRITPARQARKAF